MPLPSMGTTTTFKPLSSVVSLRSYGNTCADATSDARASDDANMRCAYHAVRFGSRTDGGGGSAGVPRSRAMKIVSKFKDYYDSMRAMDREPEPFYLRETRTL